MHLQRKKIEKLSADFCKCFDVSPNNTSRGLGADSSI
jgi:hypothetical protein